MGNGVVHVGAHKGEEVPEYLAQGRSPIVCFEPQPLRWVPPAGVQLVRIALSDVAGALEMRIPHHWHTTIERDTMSASGLPLIPERAIANGWTPTPWDTLTVPMRRFDVWADENSFISGSCTVLYIDVQGMELQVLKGFGAYLKDFQEMIIECSSPPLYGGGADANEVIEFLCTLDFTATTPVLRHGDIRFKKEIHAR